MAARWRPVLAAALGAVAVAAAVAGGVQATDPGEPPAAVAPAPEQSLLPGASDPDAVVPPAGATVPLPRFAPSAVVPTPARAATRSPRPSHRVGDGFDPGDPAYQGADDPGTAAGRSPTSGEVQREWGCHRGYIAVGC